MTVATELYGPGFFAGRTETVAMSAKVVVPLIIRYVEPVSVLDIGCGQGEWVKALRGGTGCVRGPAVYGVDISAPDAPGFIRHDLTEPLDLGGRFDLVLCLETAEHLPEWAADTLVDSIVRHADTVVFSAAVPGQEGIGHINCQPHQYWHDKFAERGYQMWDPFRPLLAGDHRVSPWYRDNLFLYEK